MRYATENLAEALFNARMARLNESAEKLAEEEEKKDVEECGDSKANEEAEEEVKEEDKEEAEVADECGDANVSEEEEAEEESPVDESRWVTMRGNHALVGDDGELLKGGDPEKRVKADRKTIDAAVKDANEKSKKSE